MTKTHQSREIVYKIGKTDVGRILWDKVFRYPAEKADNTEELKKKSGMSKNGLRFYETCSLTNAL